MSCFIWEHPIESNQRQFECQTATWKWMRKTGNTLYLPFNIHHKLPLQILQSVKSLFCSSCLCTHNRKKQVKNMETRKMTRFNLNNACIPSSPTRIIKKYWFEIRPSGKKIRLLSKGFLQTIYGGLLQKIMDKIATIYLFCSLFKCVRQKLF